VHIREIKSGWLKKSRPNDRWRIFSIKPNGCEADDVKIFVCTNERAEKTDEARAQSGETEETLAQEEEEPATAPTTRVFSP